MAPTSDRHILRDVVAHLRDANPGLCRKWFNELECAGISAGTLYVRAASDLHRRYLQAECRDAFKDAAMSATGRFLSVEFLAPEDSTPSAQHNGLLNSTHATAPMGLSDFGSDGVALNPDLTFDTFVDSPSSALAFAAAQAVGDNTTVCYNPLFIHGATGLGKTHLLHAVCHQRLQQAPADRIAFLRCRDFMDRFMAALRQQALDRFREYFRSADILLIDDIHSLSLMGQSQEEFFNTFNTLHEIGRQIVVTADSPPEAIPDLEARLVSRFTGGLRVEIRPPMYEARVQIVLGEAGRRGVDLSESIAALIAARSTQNIRQIHGDLSTVMNHANRINAGDRITLDQAQAALSIDGESPYRVRTTIPEILNTVAEYFGVSVAEIQSARRTRSITLPRHVSIYIARRITPQHSLQEIGGYVGGRDHSTVLYACRTIEHARTVDTDLDATVREIERLLGSPG